MIVRQLKTTDIANIRRQYSIRQKYVCPICKGTIASGPTALDHCHVNGHVRATLCGTCNRAEGKVRAAMRYMAKTTHLVYTDEIQFLRNLADFLEYHKENPSGLIHPTFDVSKGKQKPKKRPKRRKAKS